MADLSRVRDPLEIAAASPDAAIRAMAIRHKEMKQQLARLDGVFTVYADEVAAQTAKPAGVAKATPIRAVEKLPTSAVIAKASEFDDTLRAILANGPLSLDDLHAEYQRHVPGDTRNREAMRSALNKRRAFVGRVSPDDNRYALVGTDVSAAA